VGYGSEETEPAKRSRPLPEPEPKGPLDELELVPELPVLLVLEPVAELPLVLVFELPPLLGLEPVPEPPSPPLGAECPLLEARLEVGSPPDVSAVVLVGAPPSPPPEPEPPSPPPEPESPSLMGRLAPGEPLVPP
jgi:hypothetical protein